MKSQGGDFGANQNFDHAPGPVRYSSVFWRCSHCFALRWCRRKTRVEGKALRSAVVPSSTKPASITFPATLMPLNPASRADRALTQVASLILVTSQPKQSPALGF
jgi:hypothetical protein